MSFLGLRVNFKKTAFLCIKNVETGATFKMYDIYQGLFLEQSRLKGLLLMLCLSQCIDIKCVSNKMMN